MTGLFSFDRKSTAEKKDVKNAFRPPKDYKHGKSETLPAVEAKGVEHRRRRRARPTVDPIALAGVSTQKLQHERQRGAADMRKMILVQNLLNLVYATWNTLMEKDAPVPAVATAAEAFDFEEFELEPPLDRLPNLGRSLSAGPSSSSRSSKRQRQMAWRNKIVDSAVDLSASLDGVTNDAEVDFLSDSSDEEEDHVMTGKRSKLPAQPVRPGRGIRKVKSATLLNNEDDEVPLGHLSFATKGSTPTPSASQQRATPPSPSPSPPPSPPKRAPSLALRKRPAQSSSLRHAASLDSIKTSLLQSSTSTESLQSAPSRLQKPTMTLIERMELREREAKAEAAAGNQPDEKSPTSPDSAKSLPNFPTRSVSITPASLPLPRTPSPPPKASVRKSFEMAISNPFSSLSRKSSDIAKEDIIAPRPLPASRPLALLQAMDQGSEPKLKKKSSVLTFRKVFSRRRTPSPERQIAVLASLPVIPQASRSPLNVAVDVQVPTPAHIPRRTSKRSASASPPLPSTSTAPSLRSAPARDPSPPTLSTANLQLDFDLGSFEDEVLKGLSGTSVRRSFLIDAPLSYRFDQQSGEKQSVVVDPSFCEMAFDFSWDLKL
ncbi:hypothetical protein HKX48_000413 [Thoreauomyces humboldtii]|nr:hypothetical protein HKX48_000413 [Thoreauomyces humboldtii]